MAWLARERGQEFGGYHALWHWSVTDLDGFWQAVWDYCGAGYARTQQDYRLSGAKRAG